jgi:hypothetical protein
LNIYKSFLLLLVISYLFNALQEREMCRIKRIRKGPHRKECNKEEVAFPSKPRVSGSTMLFLVIPKPESRKRRVRTISAQEMILLGPCGVIASPPGKEG